MEREGGRAVEEVVSEREGRESSGGSGEGKKGREVGEYRLDGMEREGRVHRGGKKEMAGQVRERERGMGGGESRDKGNNVCD